MQVEFIVFLLEYLGVFDDYFSWYMSLLHNGYILSNQCMSKKFAFSMWKNLSLKVKTFIELEFCYFKMDATENKLFIQI